MALWSQRDQAALPVLCVVLAVLGVVTIGGGSVQRLGAGGAGIEAEAAQGPDEARERLEKERRALRDSLAALIRELQRPEVKRRLGIEGEANERPER